MSNTSVLDGYLLELYKKDRPLAKTLQFVLHQLDRIDEELGTIPTLTIPEGLENASLSLIQGHTEHEVPVSDRTMWTPSDSITSNQIEYQLGIRFYNRIQATIPVDISGILPATNGQGAILVNIGLPAITIKNEDAAASPEFRILNSAGGDIVLQQNEWVFIWRDNITSRWRAIKGNQLGAIRTVNDVDFGTPFKYSGLVTVSGASLGLVLGRPIWVTQGPGPYTGKGSLADEAEMDQFVAVASTRSVMGLGTVMDMYWHTVDGPIGGNFNIQFFQV
jgi:hypothetical protein